MRCERCGEELHVGDFPFCKGDAAGHRQGVAYVITDDIPGGMDIRNGICHADGTPRRYYSKSEMAKEAKRRGLTNYVVHTPPADSDKSKHTSRWI